MAHFSCAYQLDSMPRSCAEYPYTIFLCRIIVRKSWTRQFSTRSSDFMLQYKHLVITMSKLNHIICMDEYIRNILLPCIHLLCNHDCSHAVRNLGHKSSNRIQWCCDKCADTHHCLWRIHLCLKKGNVYNQIYLLNLKMISFRYQDNKLQLDQKYP